MTLTPTPPGDEGPHLVEARYLLSLSERPAMARALADVTGQFHALQTRSQLLISLVTIALTITGFSGPAMARSGAPVRGLLALGLVLVLSSALVLLLGILGLQWVTTPSGKSDEEALASIIKRRNQKTRLFALGLVLLSLGLAAYTSAVILFLVLPV